MSYSLTASPRQSRPRQKSFRQFEPCGVDPLSRKIVVVKQGYLMPGLTRISPRHIMLLTPGPSNMRIESLAYQRRRKPMYPLEPDATFDPEKAGV